MAELATKRCCRCKTQKPPSEFGINRANKDGLQRHCLDCQRAEGRSKKWADHPEEYRKRSNAKKCAKDKARRAVDTEFRKMHVAKTRDWRHNNPERVKVLGKKHRLKHMYGLTKSDLDALREAQGGVCALCGGDGGNGLLVDHDHDTGRVRGLLCQGCNTGLGMLGDDEAGLLKALDYLRRGTSQQSFLPLTFVA